MARQIPTQAERDQVNNDFETAFLPADASLDLETRTAYGTTDASIGLSMVNVRHLNATRSFRGTWLQNPMDGTLADQGLEYRAGDVVIGRTDGHLYQRHDPAVIRTAPALTMNPNPEHETGPDNARAWRQLSVGLEDAVTELTSTPETQAVNLFTASPVGATFNVSPSADALILDPEVSLTKEGTIANGDAVETFNAATETLSITVPQGQTDATAMVTATTSAESTSNSGANTHEAGQVDSVVTFTDARQEPIVELRGPSTVSRVRFGSLPEQVLFNVTLVPPGTSVAEGTAYDVEWTSTRVGSGIVSPPLNQNGSTTLPPVINPTTVRFSFPFTGRTGRNGQMGSIPPGEQNIMIDTYTPWFWQILPLTSPAPTDFTGFTESILTGDTTGLDFPAGNNTSTFPVEGTPGEINNLWLAVPTSTTNPSNVGLSEINLSAGIATVPAMRTTGTIELPLADNQGTMVSYTLWVMNLGLVSSPTTFRISSN